MMYRVTAPSGYENEHEAAWHETGSMGELVLRDDDGKAVVTYDRMSWSKVESGKRPRPRGRHGGRYMFGADGPF
jgi:hypothetical protein